MADYGKCYRCNHELNETTTCPECFAFNHTDATFNREQREARDRDLYRVMNHDANSDIHAEAANAKQANEATMTKTTNVKLTDALARIVEVIAIDSNDGSEWTDTRGTWKQMKRLVDGGWINERQTPNFTYEYQLTVAGREYARERGWLAAHVTEPAPTPDAAPQPAHEQAGDVVASDTDMSYQAEKAAALADYAGEPDAFDTHETLSQRWIHADAEPAIAALRVAPQPAVSFAVGDVVKIQGAVFGKVTRVDDSILDEAPIQVWETENKTEFVEGEAGWYSRYYARDLVKVVANATPPAATSAVSDADGYSGKAIRLPQNDDIVRNSQTGEVGAIWDVGTTTVNVVTRPPNRRNAKWDIAVIEFMHDGSGEYTQADLEIDTLRAEIKALEAERDSLRAELIAAWKYVDDIAPNKAAEKEAKKQLKKLGVKSAYN